ncbi:MAG TPA: hypothetical protein DCF84_06940 [Bacteroidetes bacterium]|nr:hypothetical protein [Bacteroidota bacterium]
MNSEPRIYFHVGLGKTGSTFLQDRFFPRLINIDYLPRNRFHRVQLFIANHPSSTILVSREFDQQLEVEARKFAESFPEARPIIVLRRPDSYIASQYRRAVKNGFRGNFKDFFDLDQDKGHFKQSDLKYDGQITTLSQLFLQPVTVLFYEDMKADLNGYLETWLRLLSARIDWPKVNLKTKHSSYTDRQLLFLQRIAAFIDLRKRPRQAFNPISFLTRIMRASLRYSLLFLGKFIRPNQQLISSKDLQRVEEAYRPMWTALRNQYDNKA